MYPLTPKSIGFVSDLYPTTVLNTRLLGLTLSEKRWATDIQTDTHTHTDRTNYSIVAHFVRGNYNQRQI